MLENTKMEYAVKLAGKISVTVFCNTQGDILVDFFPWGKAIISELHIEDYSKNPMSETQIANR